MNTIECDICRRTPSEYLAPRSEWFEVDSAYYTQNPAHICSPECLATFAIGEARRDAEAMGAAAERQAAATTKRRRWFR